MQEVILGDDPLKLEDIEKVALKKAKVKLSENKKDELRRSRNTLERISESKRIYGVNTGVGAFKDIQIEDFVEFQKRIVRSHSCGTGEPMSEEEVRAIMLVRANTLSKGFSGVRPEVVEKLVEFINEGVTPYVPEKGSVGASGDLVPLAHIALSLIGEGEVIQNGERMRTKEFLRSIGLEPLSIDKKEGVSLINGTSAMAGLSSLLVLDAYRLLKLSDVAAAMTSEAILSDDGFFREEVWKLRPYCGVREVISNLRKLTKGSTLLGKSREVHDPYSVRCTPQVHGAVREAYKELKKKIELEINSVTDNPLLVGEDIISAGNFHAQPIALALDYFIIGMTSLSLISERRISILLDEKFNRGLPSFLVEEGGKNTGFMILQYTAASLAGENKSLSYPSSVTSIPTGGGFEDLVSMGMTSVLRAKRVVENTLSVILIELMCAAQALEFRDGEMGEGTSTAYEEIRRRVKRLTEDRPLYKDVEIMKKEWRDVLQTIENRISLV
ncbi:histidine ammonia-lyase [Thermococci archaeon]|nr:MAG: histidine ammonia-lyase [Thermococci archaeon]